MMANTIPDNLPAKEILNQGNTFTVNETIEYHQDTRTLRISSLNLKNSVIGLSFESLQHCKIAHIEFFRFDSELTKKLLIEHNTDYVCGLIAISTKTGACGLRKFAIPCKNMKCDTILWAAPFQRIKGLTLVESLNYVRQKQEEWGPVRSELIESALMDLNVKLGRASKINKDQRYFWDRAYLFDHTQAYVFF
jgi:hypothetical protein